MNVSRSGFYAWATRPASARAKADCLLAIKVAEAHVLGRGMYGSPRVHRELKKQDVAISRKRVVRLMQEQGLVGRPRVKFVVTTDSAHELEIAPNLLDRNFTATAINQRLVGDITYLKTPEGWLYLAVIIDLYSRFVVGWAVMSSMPGAADVASAQTSPVTAEIMFRVLDPARVSRHAKSPRRTWEFQHALLRVMADSQFWTVSIEMIPLNGAAVVVRIEGTVTSSGGKLEVGSALPEGINVHLAPASRIVLRLSDGTDTEFESEIDKPRDLHFLPRAELEKPSENLFESQVKGFTQLLESARTMGFDASAMMKMSSVTHSREQAFEVLDADAAAALITRELARRLQIVPLRRLGDMSLIASPRWSPEKCLELLQFLQCAISPVEVSTEVFEELTQRVYG